MAAAAVGFVAAATGSTAVGAGVRTVMDSGRDDGADGSKAGERSGITSRASAIAGSKGEIVGSTAPKIAPDFGSGEEATATGNLVRAGSCSELCCIGTASGVTEAGNATADITANDEFPAGTVTARRGAGAIGCSVSLSCSAPAAIGFSATGDGGTVAESEAAGMADTGAESMRDDFFPVERAADDLVATTVAADGPPLLGGRDAIGVGAINAL